MKFTIVFIISCLCGVFYRIGGSRSFNTKFRDVGCSLCMTVSILILTGLPSILEAFLLFLSTGIMFGALTTYRYFLPKPKNYTCWYYMMHGFFISLAIMPWAIAAGYIVPVAIRCVVAAGLVSLWSGLLGHDVREEFGRGFILNATLLFLLMSLH